MVVRIDIILCARNNKYLLTHVVFCENISTAHSTRYLEAAVYVYPIVELRVKDKASTLIFALVKTLYLHDLCASRSSSCLLLVCELVVIHLEGNKKLESGSGLLQDPGPPRLCLFWI